MALLHIENLSWQSILKDISLSVEPAEILVLLGQSGSGKTSLLRSIAGLERPDSGAICYQNKMLFSSKHPHTPAHQRGMGMVFQDLALFPHLTVGDNIRLGLHALNKTTQNQRIQDALSLVGLVDLIRRYPYECSGGQQQRIAIARTLAQQTPLVLMDEPFSSLDQSLRSSLNQEVKKLLRQQKIAAIIVTHDQAEAMSLGDRIGLIHQGRLLEISSPSQLYHAPQNPLTAEFLGEGIWLDAEQLTDGSLFIPRLGRTFEGNSCPLHASRGRIRLRPEQIIYTPHSPLRATISSVEFQGATCRYELTVDDQRLLAHLPSHLGFHLEQTIGIDLNLDNLIYFPE